MSHSRSMSNNNNNSPSPPQNQLNHNDNANTLCHITPLWLDDQWDDALLARLSEGGPETADEMSRRVVDYATLFMDFVMMQLELKSAPQYNNAAEVDCVEKKWLAYIDSRARAWGHSQLAYLFIATYARTTSRHLDPRTDAYTKHWLSMQLYLFSAIIKSNEVTDFVAKFGQRLQRHVSHTSRYRSVLDQWPHAHWHSLCIRNSEDDTSHPGPYWLSMSSDNQKHYVASSRWLFEPEFVELVGVVPPPANGMIVLTEALLVKHLLPALYRHTLLDLLALLCHVNNDREPKIWWDCHLALYGDDTARGVSLLKQLVARDLFYGSAGRNGIGVPLFDCDTVYTELLLEYNLQQQAYASPVTEYMPRYMKQKKRRIATANKKRAASDSGNAVALLMDIEELFAQPDKVLPPCLSRVVKQDWYKNKDRWNLVAYLIDMGYDDKAAVVSQLCRKRTGGFDNATIESLYDDRIKKKHGKNAKESYLGRCSPRCGTIINATFEADNNLRCLYEERANGEQRRANHSDGEKKKFTRQCASAMGDAEHRVLSPMDYIGYKAKRLAQQQQQSSVSNEIITNESRSHSVGGEKS